MVRIEKTHWAKLLLLSATLLLGCSGSKESASTQSSEKSTERARDAALQHFIDGSIFEMKGDYAQAILEYQDALRYDQNDAVHFALSKCYSRLGKHALAIEAGREAVRISPGQVDYWRNLGDAYAAAFQLDSAAAAYEGVVRLDSNSIEAWFTLASLYQGRKPLKALEIYESIIERFGDEWEVLFQVAELYNAIGQNDKAIGALEKMIALDPGNMELKRSLAQTYVRAEQYDKALKLYEDLREARPGDVDLLGEMATVHLLRKEYTTAAGLFELLLARDSVSVDAKLKIGETYFSQMQKDSSLIPVARSMFERIRDGHPNDWRAYWFLGAIGGVARDDSFAVANFKRVTELASWNPDGWSYLALTYLQEERFQDVVTILEEGIKTVPDDFQVNLYLGIAYSRLRQTSDALRVLQHARAIDPKDLRALSQLALLYDTEKRSTESDSLYEEALKIDPDNHLILNNYAYSLADRGLQLERALQMARIAVDAQPENPSYLDTIGWIYFRLEQYVEAETYIKRAIEKGEASAVVHEHLGDVYYRINEKEKALEQWNTALQLDNGNQALREKISRGSL